MPSLRRRKDRGNRFQLHYVDVDGKQYRVNTGTTDKKIAKLWLHKVEELLTLARHGMIETVGRIDVDVVAGKKKPQAPKGEKLTLEEFRDRYERRCRDDLELSASTIELNSLAFRSLIGVVEDKPMRSLTDEDIVTWKQNLLSQGRSRATVGVYFRHLRAAFNRAVRWKMIESSPFLLVEDVKEKRGRRKEKDMSNEEVRQLLKAMDQAEDFQFKNLVLLLLYTGCRRNECLFLRWENIDLENRILTVWAEKTKREMEIPINNALMKVIQSMERKEEGYVFQSRSMNKGAHKKDKPWNKDFVSHHFKDYIRVLGLSEEYSLHSLRHTFTNHLLQKGVPLERVQRLLGHSSVRTTAENYDHTIALHFRKESDLVNFEEDEEDEGDAAGSE